MRSLFVFLFASIACPVGIALSAEITNEASAIAAAKRYTKSRCTKDTPCTYRARREGKQWNVFVEFTKRNQPGQAPQRYPGGHILLYFDQQGALVKRVEGQ